MTQNEFVEWRYYFSVVPADGEMISQHIAFQTAVQRWTKGDKKAKVGDFLIDYSAKKSQKDTKKEAMKKLLKKVKGKK